MLYYFDSKYVRLVVAEKKINFTKGGEQITVRFLFMG